MLLNVLLTPKTYTKVVNCLRPSTSTSQTLFDNVTAPYQPHLESYNARMIAGKKRSFNTDYFKYKWLEYNLELDACFCFPCRVFLPNSKEKTFTRTGCRDWKHAQLSGKGMIKHNKCPSHITAMSLWEDRNKRERSHATIQDSVATPSSDQKQWLFAVFNVIRYLSANGLPLRGDTESDIESGGGLFMRAFSQLLFPLDPELFTIMADGTTDKNRKETQGLICRHWTSSGKIEEHCLDIKGVDDRSAKGIFQFIKETLAEYDIGTGAIVSQSYDGASVMSGEFNGLQRLISQLCQRCPIYTLLLTQN